MSALKLFTLKPIYVINSVDNAKLLFYTLPLLQAPQFLQKLTPFYSVKFRGEVEDGWIH